MQPCPTQIAIQILSHSASSQRILCIRKSQVPLVPAYYCWLFIVYCLLFIAYCLLFIADCLLLIVYCLLLIVYCLLLTSELWPVLYCLLFIAYYLLLITFLTSEPFPPYITNKFLKDDSSFFIVLVLHSLIISFSNFKPF